MSSRAYLVISGAVFGIVAILHLLRVVNNWAFVLGPWPVPMWVSLAGHARSGCSMCLGALRLTSGIRT
jgi:hypothetical protein